MSLATAIVVFDVVVFLILALDFALVSRRNTAVVARVPVLLLTVALAVLATRLDAGSMEFVAIGVVVLGAALFGYANFLAFVKRGITFSILQNHARPPGERRPDADFIFLEDRLEEMRGYGWVEADAAGWRLKAHGQRVVRIRRALLRWLGIEAVG